MHINFTQAINEGMVCHFLVMVFYASLIKTRSIVPSFESKIAYITLMLHYVTYIYFFCLVSVIQEISQWYSIPVSPQSYSTCNRWNWLHTRTNCGAARDWTRNACIGGHCASDCATGACCYLGNLVTDRAKNPAVCRDLTRVASAATSPPSK